MRKPWIREILYVSAAGAVALPGLMKVAMVFGEFISTLVLRKNDPTAQAYFIDIEVELPVPFMGRKSFGEPWCWVVLALLGGCAGGMLGLMRDANRGKDSLR